jgi:hypothetical protein
MRLRFCLSVGLATAALIMAAGSVMAETPLATESPEPTGLSATLEGEPIGLDAVGALACHDLEYPVIRCFRTVDRLLAAIGSSDAGDASGTSSATTASTPYVIAFDLFYYGGSNPKVLSTDEPWLVVIGWNDVTSSFKSYGAVGRWREHSPAGGFVYSYGSTTQVPWLSATYNNKFSAFEID